MPDPRHAALPEDVERAEAMREAVVNRCRHLGVAAFVADDERPIHPACGPTGPDGSPAHSAAAFLASSALAARVANAWAVAHGVPAGDRRGVVRGDLRPVYPGAFLLTVSPTVAAFLPTVRAIAGDDFKAICGHAKLDPTAVAAGLAPCLLAGAGEPARTATAVRLSADDLARNERDGRTVSQLTEKLAQAYEETSLLFRLPRYLNDDAGPAAAIRRMVDEIAETLPFQWLAVRFAPSAPVGDLAGRLVCTGPTPLDPAPFVAHIDRLGGMGDGGTSGGESPDGEPGVGKPLASAGHRGRLLLPSEGGLAAAVGCEVLAEPIAHDGRTVGWLVAGGKPAVRPDDPDVSSGEAQFVDAAAGLLGIFHENLGRFDEIRGLFLGTLRALTASIDAKDPYTRGHSERVALLAADLAAALGLDARAVERYRIAGLVHDVGKIGVPEAVLGKAGRPTPAEYDLIKKHPEIGEKILGSIGDLADVLPGVLHHHERFDGRGYPHGLAGTDIPPIARALALVDTFDAMSSTRSYRAAMPRDAVLAEFARCGGSQFDPAMLDVFLSMDFTSYDALLRSHAAGHPAEAEAAEAAPVELESEATPRRRAA